MAEQVSGEREQMEQAIEALSAKYPQWNIGAFAKARMRDMYKSGYAQALEDVCKQIDSSTGPTGGWLDSPKALFAAIRSLAKGKEGSNGLDL